MVVLACDVGPLVFVGFVAGTNSQSLTGSFDAQMEERLRFATFDSALSLLAPLSFGWTTFPWKQTALHI